MHHRAERAEDSPASTVIPAAPPDPLPEAVVRVALSPTLWDRAIALDEHLGAGFRTEHVPAGGWDVDVVLLATSDVHLDDASGVSWHHPEVIVVETRAGNWPEERVDRAVGFLSAGAAGYLEHAGIEELAANVRALARRLHTQDRRP